MPLKLPMRLRPELESCSPETLADLFDSEGCVSEDNAESAATIMRKTESENASCLSYQKGLKLTKGLRELPCLAEPPLDTHQSAEQHQIQPSIPSCIAQSTFFNGRYLGGILSLTQPPQGLADLLWQH
ncbi:hypothetical protein Q31a_01230 [Aureliella helgolandensis]|uniref:Uncharacterized protein n=1 Tax=Aureliella helgolandensis TaxID=2527968 RepID=A0A518G003_9BACT|nr:hypothetical protein Q31a_01230 [Aureliella helgolandensis]